MLRDRASERGRTTSFWPSAWGTVALILGAIGPAAAQVDPPIPSRFDAADTNPVQAIQLADTAVSLSGTGSSSPLDSLQKRLGVDRVDVTSTRTVDPHTGKVTETPLLIVGKDIGQNVHLSVESTVGQEGSDKIGLRLQYDY